MDLTLLFLDWGMDFWLPALLIACIAYFWGCFNGAVIVSKYILRNDVRKHGSGNAGLTNFHRTFGGPLTLVVILTDVIKAILAITIGVAIAKSAFGAENAIILARYWAGLWCLIGHMFPCMFQFKGGKGILSGGTVAIMIDWRLALLVWGAFILLVVLTRYVSLGSIAAGGLFPVGTALFVVASWNYEWIIMVLGTFIGVLIIWKHRANLMRLIQGNESKFSLKKKKETGV